MQAFNQQKRAGTGKPIVALSLLSRNQFVTNSLKQKLSHSMCPFVAAFVGLRR